MIIIFVINNTHCFVVVGKWFVMVCNHVFHMLELLSNQGTGNHSMVSIWAQRTMQSLTPIPLFINCCAKCY